MQAFDHADIKADEAAEAALAGIPRAIDRLERLLLIYAGADAVFRDDWVLWVEMWRSAIFDERLAESVRRSIGWLDRADRRPDRRGPGRGLAGPRAERRRRRPGGWRRWWTGSACRS